MNVDLGALQELAQHASKPICDEYVKTLSKCVRHEDLPGIWPKFYLYSDLDWTLGYKPEAKRILLGSLDVKNISSQDLFEDLAIEILANGHNIIKPDAPAPAETVKEKSAHETKQRSKRKPKAKRAQAVLR